MNAAFTTQASILWLLSMYNYLDTKTTELREFSRKVYEGVQDSLSEKVYILFESISAPYRLSSVNISASSSALPDWYYFPSTHTFVEWMPGSVAKNGPLQNGHTYDLPILSMEILAGEDVVCDLTDFIASVKVHTYSMDVLPSIAHLLGAWSIHSGIVLDRGRNFMVRVIDTRANTIDLHTEDHEFMSIESEDKPEDIPVLNEPLQEAEIEESPTNSVSDHVSGSEPAPEAVDSSETTT